MEIEFVPAVRQQGYLDEDSLAQLLEGDRLVEERLAAGGGGLPHEVSQTLLRVEGVGDEGVLLVVPDAEVQEETAVQVRGSLQAPFEQLARVVDVVVEDVAVVAPAQPRAVFLGRRRLDDVGPWLAAIEA